MAAGVATYVYPSTGLVAPTTAQIGLLSEVCFDVVFGVNDTIVTVVHNMNCPSASGADGLPEISWALLAGGVLAPLPVFAYVNANSISVAKAAVGATTDATYRVWLKRHTIDR